MNEILAKLEKLEQKSRELLPIKSSVKLDQYDVEWMVSEIKKHQHELLAEAATNKASVG